jgi:hypothetical protein
MGNRYVMDGKNYVEVERKAKVGEKVVITEVHPSLVYTNLGEIVEIIETDGETCGGMLKPHDIGSRGAVYRFQYRVLEPTPDVTDLLANLANRVHSLEQQLRDTQGNVEKLAEELSTVKHETQPKEAEAGLLELIADSVATKLFGGERR